MIRFAYALEATFPWEFRDPSRIFLHRTVLRPDFKASHSNWQALLRQRPSPRTRMVH